MSSYYTEGNKVMKDLGDPEQLFVCLCEDPETANDIVGALNIKEDGDYCQYAKDCGHKDED